MGQHDTLVFLNHLALSGQTTFTSTEAEAFLERSPQSTSNTLSRMCNQGLITRVSKGVYITRAPGMYGTSPVSADVLKATAAALGSLRHRVAFRSALSYHGLLTHPTSVIQVASPSRLGRKSIAEWPLEVTYEEANTLMIGAIDSGKDVSPVSTIERALLESARNITRVGGASVVADAIDSTGGEFEVVETRRLAKALRIRPAIQRLSSIARYTGYEDVARALTADDKFLRVVSIEPGATEVARTDPISRVNWPQSTLDEIAGG